MIQELFQSYEIQDMVKQFLFHTERTSPTVASVYASKQKINHLLESGSFLCRRTKVNNFQSMSIPVYQLFIFIDRQNTLHGRRALQLTAHNCIECGEYYKDAKMYGTRMYHGTPIPDKIVCKCNRKVYQYRIEDLDYR